MKKLLLVVLLILFGTLTMSHAKKNTMYYMQINAHLMYCEARINGMYLFHTLQQTRNIPELLTMGQPISEYMNNGKNMITLKGLNNSENLKPEDVAGGYCELTITAQTFNAETHEKEERKVLSNIRIIYKKQDNSDQLIYELSVDGKKVNNGSANEIVYIGSTPMTDDDYSTKTYGQEISVAEAYPFRWIHESTPIVDNRENREEVWNAYRAIKQAILNKDKAAIKKMALIGATDVANYQKDNVDNHFDIVFDQLLQEYFEFDPEVWVYENLGKDNFNLEIYAGGKLFRLVEKGAYISSPLSWKNQYTGMYRSYNQLFTMIDGKVVMAIF